MTTTRRAVIRLAVMWAVFYSAPSLSAPFTLLCTPGNDNVDCTDDLCRPACTENIFLDLSDDFAVCDAVINNPNTDLWWRCFDQDMHTTLYCETDNFSGGWMFFSDAMIFGGDSQQFTRLFNTADIGDVGTQVNGIDLQAYLDVEACSGSSSSSSSSTSSGGGTYNGPTAEEVHQLFTDGATLFTYALSIICFFMGFFAGMRSQ